MIIIKIFLRNDGYNYIKSNPTNCRPNKVSHNVPLSLIQYNVSYIFRIMNSDTPQGSNIGLDSMIQINNRRFVIFLLTISIFNDHDLDFKETYRQKQKFTYLFYYF